MRKMLKWAYDLGIRHERVRIASHLQLESTRAHNSMDRDMEFMRVMNESPKIKVSKSAKEKLDFNIAVNHRVQQIIQNMFESSPDKWIPGASVMFPDDEHKGKIK